MKTTRRGFVAGITATSVLRSIRASPIRVSKDTANPLQYVDPMIGTGGYGHCFPAATVPFGAVQLGPDTGDHDWDHCSGYHYDDKKVLGFSHTHLSGTGVGDMQDFRFMPAYLHDVNTSDPRSFAAEFTHAEETAEAGYYRLKLRKPDVLAELTATERTGAHRYHFARQKAYCVLVDLSNVWRLSKPKPNEPLLVNWARLRHTGKGFFASRSTAAWADGRKIYGYAGFSHAPSKCELFVDGRPLPSGTQLANGKAVHAVFHFDDLPNGILIIKTAISGVDDDGAKRNFERESTSDFERLREAARQKWVAALGSVRVTAGGDERQRRIFYTGLYHAMLAPTLFDDVDGRYRGMDGEIHTLKKLEHNYSTFSLWDTYRALHPMLTLLTPEMVPQLCNCIVRQSEESPKGVVVWPLQGKETGCMDGYHSAPVIAEAIRKGFKGIDLQTAYRLFKKRADLDDYRGLGAYRHYGYVPCDVVEQSASRTCNYAYDDWCVAALAEACGDTAHAMELRTRSSSYRNLYDSSSGFIRPRFADGSWARPFDPRAITVTRKWRDYEEANGWQTTFLAQHDADGICEMLGGRKALEAKLDQLFHADSGLPPEMLPPDITGLIGQYCQGNEPSHHIAYLYNTAGAPHKAQSRVHQIMTDWYHDAPDAFAGNEDCGQMSAWYCLNALGFYPVDPVSGRYDIGSPLFDEVMVKVGKAAILRIKAHRESERSVYVSSVSFNGMTISGWSISHEELAQGGTLLFHLIDKPEETRS